MKKKKIGDPWDFDHSMVVDLLWTGLSIPESAGNFTHSSLYIITVSIQWVAGLQAEMPCWWVMSEKNGQTGLSVQDSSKTITTLCTCDSGRPNRAPMLLAKNRNLRLRMRIGKIMPGLFSMFKCPVFFFPGQPVLALTIYSTKCQNLTMETVCYYLNHLQIMPNPKTKGNSWTRNTRLYIKWIGLCGHRPGVP